MANTKRSPAADPETTIIGVRIPVELRAELDRVSTTEAGGYSAVVRKALANHLGRPELTQVGRPELRRPRKEAA